MNSDMFHCRDVGRIMGTAQKLSARQVLAIKHPGYYGDGNGLWLQVSVAGGRIRKSWVYRYAIRGRSREMGLGPLNVCSLMVARERAAAARQQVRAGVDPIAAREAAVTAARIEAARGVTFSVCVEQYIAAHSPSWKNEKHREQWTATLATYAEPVIGALPVSSIDTTMVLKIIEPIWTEKPETASRVRGRIESVLDWAKVRGYRKGENPALWKGHLDKLLPAKSKVRKVKHHAAMPFQDLPDFIVDLRQQEGMSARALEFTILNASRTGEVIGARWPEFDFAAKVWTIPAERMKAGVEHRVPLSDRSLEILGALPRESEFVFPGARPKQPLSNMAMLELLKGMKPGYTVHGFRSTFRDWASERTNYANHIVEMALAHTIGNAVEAAYRRGDLLEKRRRLARDWEKFCSSKPRADNVIPLLQGTVNG